MSDEQRAAMIQGALVRKIDDSPTLAVVRLDTAQGNEFFLATKSTLRQLSEYLTEVADQLEDAQ